MQSFDYNRFHTKTDGWVLPTCFKLYCEIPYLNCLQKQTQSGPELSPESRLRVL